MNPKISVLVPIYKTAAYIEKCVVSLFNQTFEDIEYIFVNDATPDNSIELLEKTILKFPKRKQWVTIVHHETNKGLAAARNTALDLATGDFVCIVDSDDYIELNMLETLYNKAKQEDADIVISDFLKEFNQTQIPFCNEINTNKWTNFENLLSKNKISNSLCSKLIRRTLYNHPKCRVPSGLNYMEDGYVVIRMFYFAKKIAKVDQAFYHYVQYNHNSITRTIERMHFENVVLFWKLLDEFLIENKVYKHYQTTIELSKVKSKINLMRDTHSSKLRKEYYEMFNEIELKYVSNFRKGEVIILLLVRYRLFALAQLFHNLLVFKNKKSIRR